MTHCELVEIGTKWLKRHTENMLVPNCPLVCSEMVTVNNMGEVPDVIGWGSGNSVLIEVKVSRADFLRDKKKLFRRYPDMGTGDYKYYLCPTGIIRPEDLNEPYGLLVYDGRKVVIEKVAPLGVGNLRSERDMLLSIIRRAKTTDPFWGSTEFPS